MNRKPLILVVDDKEETCESIESSLTMRGYQVHTAQRVEDGIGQLRACLQAGWKLGHYSVAVIDLNFGSAYDGPNPQTAGMLVVNEALKVPFLEPIILTAYPSVETATDALACGVFRYVTKSDHGSGNESFMGRLATAVNLALQARSVMMALEEDLRQLQESLARLRNYMNTEKQQHGQASEVLDYAQSVLFDAEQVYRRLVSARGKHPDASRKG